MQEALQKRHGEKVIPLSDVTTVFERIPKNEAEDIQDARAFFKKGAKWLTANELARYGVNEIFKKFPR